MEDLKADDKDAIIAELRSKIDTLEWNESSNAMTLRCAEDELQKRDVEKSFLEGELKAYKAIINNLINNKR